MARRSLRIDEPPFAEATLTGKVAPKADARVQHKTVGRTRLHCSGMPALRSPSATRAASCGTTSFGNARITPAIVGSH